MHFLFYVSVPNLVLIFFSSRPLTLTEVPRHEGGLYYYPGRCGVRYGRRVPLERSTYQYNGYTTGVECDPLRTDLGSPCAARGNPFSQLD